MKKKNKAVKSSKKPSTAKMGHRNIKHTKNMKSGAGHKATSTSPRRKAIKHRKGKLY